MKGYILSKVNKFRDVSYVKRLILVFLTDCLSLMLAIPVGYFVKCLFL